MFFSESVEVESCFGLLLLQQSALRDRLDDQITEVFFNPPVMCSQLGMVLTVSAHLLHIRLGRRSAQYAVSEQLRVSISTAL